MDPAFDRRWLVVRGDDQSRTFQITEDDGTTPVDLTGRSYTWSIAASLGGTVLLTGSATVSDAANGYVEVVLTDTQTATLTEPIYSYDVVEVDGSNEATIVIGNIHTTARVTA